MFGEVVTFGDKGIEETRTRLAELKAKRDKLDEGIKDLRKVSETLIKEQVTLAATKMVSTIPFDGVSIQEGSSKENVITVSFDFKIDEIKKTGQQLLFLITLCKLAQEAKSGNIFGRGNLDHLIFLPTLKNIKLEMPVGE